MMTITGKVIFAGGGTGGHVYPALACIEALLNKGKFDILYIGGHQGIENKIVPRFHYAFKKIWISGFQRTFTLKNFLFPLKLLVSLWQSIMILFKYKPDVVIGTGGYVSGPVLYTAAKMGIPTLIQEQDSYPGVTTRLLARYCNVVCVPYEEVIPLLKKVKGSIIVTGVPIRRSLQLPEKHSVLKEWDFRDDIPVILIFGGSQGAQSLNRAMLSIVPEIMKQSPIQLLWQTGEKNFEEIRQSPLAGEEGIQIMDYIHSMEKAYAVADIIISRAGAITLAELALVQKPCILVPYPFAAAQHQEKNAETIAGLGAAFIVKEGKGFEEKLTTALSTLLNDNQLADAMGKKWNKVYRPDASEKIATEIINLMAN
ncbi:MAG: undecaprenyldiphospho-muramoylpentapeptide beta-N-acetylglucosaminyltransferase [bacterium]|nr:MAG: undecaprenyldiphospho-muramoylpentapeptide beta-N-acetylglucosaminyltransferase [bacterium]